jgi:hypothetical protein
VPWLLLDRIVTDTLFQPLSWVKVLPLYQCCIYFLGCPSGLSRSWYGVKNTFGISLFSYREQLSNLVQVQLVKLDWVFSSLISYASLCFTLSTLVNSSFLSVTRMHKTEATFLQRWAPVRNKSDLKGPPSVAVSEEAALRKCALKSDRIQLLLRFYIPLLLKILPFFCNSRISCSECSKFLSANFSLVAIGLE